MFGGINEGDSIASFAALDTETYRRVFERPFEILARTMCWETLFECPSGLPRALSPCLQTSVGLNPLFKFSPLCG